MRRVMALWRGLFPALLVLLLECVLTPAIGREVRYFQADSRYAYRTHLLQLILEKSRDEGAFTLQPLYTNVTPDRGLTLLQSRRIDVVSLPATPEREQLFRAVPVDIMRGLLGYRVLLIRKQRQADFSAIRSLEQLRNFSVGFGSQWADLPILQHNGLNVVATPQYQNLFAMLDKGRFDAFPRGLNEAWHEVEERTISQPDLVVESSLLLYYPYPVYFFVNRDDKALAERLERGLARAQADGSMRRLFLQYHAEALRQANLAQRHLISLENPLLPSGFHEPDTSWWLPASLGH